MSSVFRSVLFVALVATACRAGESPGACTSPSPKAGDAATVVVATNRARPVARVLGGEHALRDGVWTGSEYVLAHDGQSIWRIRADAPGSAELTAFREPITNIAGARSVDVGVVLTATAELHVMRAGRTERTFDGPVPLSAPGLQLSDDGAVAMVTGFQRGSGLLGRAAAFSTHDGAELGKLDDQSATLDPRGEFVQSAQGIFALRGMKRIADSPPGVASWIDHRVVFLDETTLSVVDTKTGKTTRIRTGCDRRGITRTDAVDVIKRRVVLDCGARVVFVGIDDASVVVVPLVKKHQWVDAPWTGPGEAPERFELLAPLLARDGDSAFIRRDGPSTAPLIEVDPIARTGRALAAGATPMVRSGSSSIVGSSFPPCRIGPKQASADAWCHALPSPDERAALLIGATGGLSIIDARTGTRRVGWGMPVESDLRVADRRTSNGGVDVVDTMPTSGVPARVLRVGPPEPGPPNAPRAPRYPRRAPCPLTLSDSRTLAGRELYFGTDGACVCDAAKCAPFAIGRDERVVDASAERVVAITIAAYAPTRTRILDVAGAVVAEARMPGLCRDGTLLDDGQTLALLCEERNDAGQPTRALLELALPKLAATRRATAPDVPVPGGERILGGGKRALLLDDSAGTTASANVFERADGRVSARLYTWATSAVVRFDDGRVELFGAEADQAIVCVEDDRVTPFATCRDALMVRDRFRLD